MAKRTARARPVRENKAKKGPIGDREYVRQVLDSGIEKHRAYVVDRRLAQIGVETLRGELKEKHGVKISRRALERFTSDVEMPEQSVSADETLVKRSGDLAPFEDTIRGVVAEGGDCLEVQKRLRTRHKVVCFSCHILSYLQYEIDDTRDAVIGRCEGDGDADGDRSESMGPDELMQNHGDFCRSKVAEGVSVRDLIGLLFTEAGRQYSFWTVRQVMIRIRSESGVLSHGGRKKRVPVKAGNWDVDQVMCEHGEYVRQCREQKIGHRILRQNLIWRGVQVSEHTAKRLLLLADKQIVQAEPAVSTSGGAVKACASDAKRIRYIDPEDILVEFSDLLRGMVADGLEAGAV